MQEMFEDETPIKCQPELRHVLAHLSSAIEAIAEGRPMDCLDNLKSVEGLVFFMEDDKNDWEKYYEKEYQKWLKRKAKQKQSAKESQG